MPKDKEQIHPKLGIQLYKMPRHVAIIMDGNGRWAEKRGLPRVEGHRAGGDTVRLVTTTGAKLGLECLTLYSFSTENWKRPKEEVKRLMELYAHYLIRERETIMKHNIKVRHLGFEQGLPDFVIKELHETLRLSENNTGMTLCLALNYSGRSELIHAIQKIAGKVQEGQLAPADINEQTVSDELDTAGLPDPDLLIRTSGEMRISNFLLWQISYTELYTTDAFWPDLTVEIIYDAIKAYSQRNRRFGGLG